MIKNFYFVYVYEIINEIRVKMFFENMCLIGYEGNFLRDEFMETEFNEISNFVYIFSYYMAVSMFDVESYRFFKVIIFFQDKIDNYLGDFLDIEIFSLDLSKLQVKRSQSDFVIFIFIFNLQGVCLGINLFLVKKDKIFKKRVVKFSEYGKYVKYSFIQILIQSFVEEMGYIGRRLVFLIY